MPLDFPSNPSTGTVYTGTNNIIYTYDGEKWLGTSPQGSIIPSGNLVYDLGNSSYQWRHLYVGTSTIYIGNKALSVTPAGDVTVDGNTVGGGVTPNSTTTFTNKTLNITLGGNTLQIQGNSVYSYSGSGPVLALTQMPTFQGYNINNSSISIDGGSGLNYWTAGSADGTGIINKAGAYRSTNTVSNALFTFGANGAGTMSVQLEGSLFVGSTLPNNNGGLNTDYPGWLVVSSGGKFGGDIDTLGRVLLNGNQFEDDSGVVDFFNVSSGNHIITCSSDWTLKLKARAAAANQGNLWLEAGQHTKIKIKGNGSNIEVIASTGTNAKIWTFNNSGNIVFPDSTVQTTAYVVSAEPKFNVVAASFTATVNTRYGVSTTATAVTVDLPPSPSIGDAVFFADAGGSFSSNNLTINRNGNTIMGSAANTVVNVNGDSLGLFWNGSTWRLYE